MDLYESTAGATVKGIAADLGISRGALKEWVGRLGSELAVPGSALLGSAFLGSGRRSGSHAGRVVRLEVELAASRAEARKLETERDILRPAVKYFAGETNW